MINQQERVMPMKNFLSKLNYTKKSKISVDTPLASTLIAKNLVNIFINDKVFEKKLIIICIGTDRSTGDSLGPLVGSRLKNKLSKKSKVYGCIVEPVHAVNLNETLSNIKKEHIKPYIIAVDASLGNSKNVGNINVEKGSLKPGTGVNKTLPEVGDCHITGTVNVGGFMEYMVLQNTRLKTVIPLSIIISKGVSLAVNYITAYKDKDKDRDRDADYSNKNLSPLKS